MYFHKSKLNLISHKLHHRHYRRYHCHELRIILKQENLSEYVVTTIRSEIKPQIINFQKRRRE